MRVGAFVFVVFAFAILASIVFYLDYTQECGSLPCVVNYITGNVVFEELVITGNSVLEESNENSLEKFFRSFFRKVISPFREEGQEVLLQASGGCNDGLDNDNDGLIDWQYDLGCSDSTDSNESREDRLDENGWTTFDLSNDARVVFVSSSSGSSNCASYTKAQLQTHAQTSYANIVPCQTIAQGRSLLNSFNNVPNWLLIKRGDTFSESISGWSKSGRSESEPFVIGTYGPSIQRPTLQGGGFSNNGVINYVALTGLEFLNIGFHAVNINDRFNYLLIENNHIENVIGSSGINLELFPITRTNLQIRRNILNDIDQNGIYIQILDGGLIEENIISNIRQGIFHAMYIQPLFTKDVTVKGNIVKVGKDNGNAIMNRGGSIVTDNYITDFGWSGIVLKTCDDASETCTFAGGLESSIIKANDNVILGARPLSGIGQGIQIGDNIHLNILAGSEASGNIIANTPSGINGAPLFISQNTDNFAAENNIIYNWGSGYPLISGTGANAPLNFIFRNNQIQNHIVSSALIYVNDLSAMTSSILVRNNKWYSALRPLNSWFLTPNSMSFAQWQSTTQETGSATNINYIAPTRSLSSYAAFIGLAGNEAAFFTSAEGKSRLNWDNNYNAYRLNDYIREGFAVNGLFVPALTVTVPSVGGQTQLQLSWTDSISDETGFTIQRRALPDGVFMNVADVGANVVAYTDTGLITGQSYQYRVKTLRNSEYSSWSNLGTGTTSSSTGQTCSSVTQYGVTFTFSASVPCGQFVNLDYWVQAPVTVTSITPNFAAGRNGFMINPTQFTQHGYDSRDGNYNAGLVPSLPLTITTSSSIVKAVSNDATAQCENSPGETCYLDTAAVLTVLTTPPSATSFRPAYAGTQKTLYDSSNLQTQLLPSLTPPTGVTVPTLTEIENKFRRVQLDYPNWGYRVIHPDKNLRNYGADISIDTGNAALRLMLNDPVASKMNALIYYVQAGIDYHGMISNGANYGVGGGGHENGRKAPVAFASILLNDQQMKNSVINSAPTVFGENKISALGNGGVVLAAQESCSEIEYWTVLHNTDPGSKTCKDPYGYIDGGLHPLDGYQQTFSNAAVGGALAITLLPGGTAVWNNPLSLQYLSRWVPSGAYTQPDPCAPAPGVCVGGVPGATCSSAVAVYSSSTGSVTFPCPGGGTCNLAAPTPLSPPYGVTYGPNGAGGCLPGIGRFPNLHLVGHGNGYSSAFANAMWLQYYPSSFDFFVGIAPASGSVMQGNSVTPSPTVTATYVSGTSSPVLFSATNLQTGVTAQFNPASCTPVSGNPCTSTMTLTASPTASVATNQITITGTSGSTVRNINYALTTTYSPPAAPTNLVATAQSSNSVLLTWIDNAVNENGYWVGRCTGNGCTNFAPVMNTPLGNGNLPINSVTYTDTGLTANTVYRYIVAAWNLGPGTSSNIATVTTTASAPNSPTGLTVTTPPVPDGWTKLNLAWNDVSGETSYEIQRRQAPGWQWATIHSTGPDVTTYFNSGLSYNTYYEYRIRAVNSAGASEWHPAPTANPPFVSGNTFNPVPSLTSLNPNVIVNNNPPSAIGFIGNNFDPLAVIYEQTFGSFGTFQTYVNTGLIDLNLNSLTSLLSSIYGEYYFYVLGGGGISSQSRTLTVNRPFGFEIDVNPSSSSGIAGSLVNNIVVTFDAGLYRQNYENIVASINSPNAGITTSFVNGIDNCATSSSATSCTVRFNINVGAGVLPGPYTLVVSGNSISASGSMPFTLTVNSGTFSQCSQGLPYTGPSTGIGCGGICATAPTPFLCNIGIACGNGNDCVSSGPTGLGLCYNNICSLDDDGDGVANTIDLCPSTPYPLPNGHSVNLNNGCTYLAHVFSTSLTTDLSSVPNLLAIEDLSVGIVGMGMIEYAPLMSLMRYNSVSGLHTPISLSDAIIIEDNLVGVKSNGYPEMNESANITLYSIPGAPNDFPVIVKVNGLIRNICTECSVSAWDPLLRDISFSVNGFSNYTTENSTCGDNYCSSLASETCSSCSLDCGGCPGGTPGGGSPGGSSGGSSGGGVPKKKVQKPQCSDLIDNDGDGKTDYPLDLGCVSLNGTTELDSEILQAFNATRDEEEIKDTEKDEIKDVEISLVFWIAIIILTLGIIAVGIIIVHHVHKQRRFLQYLNSINHKN